MSAEEIRAAGNEIEQCMPDFDACLERKDWEELEQWAGSIAEAATAAQNMALSLAAEEAEGEDEDRAADDDAEAEDEETEI